MFVTDKSGRTVATLIAVAAGDEDLCEGVYFVLVADDGTRPAALFAKNGDGTPCLEFYRDAREVPSDVNVSVRLDKDAGPLLVVTRRGESRTVSLFDMAGLCCKILDDQAACVGTGRDVTPPS